MSHTDCFERCVKENLYLLDLLIVAVITLRGQKHNCRDNHKESPTGIKAAAIVGRSFVEMDSMFV